MVERARVATLLGDILGMLFDLLTKNPRIRKILFSIDWRLGSVISFFLGDDLLTHFTGEPGTNFSRFRRKEEDKANGARTRRE